MKKSKTCVICKKIKPLEDFHNCKKSGNGKQSRCKQCACETARRWYVENLKGAKQSRKKWYENNKEKHHEYGRDWVKNHREQEIVRHKKYREEHKEQCSAYAKKWYAQNKDRKNDVNNKYRNKRRHDEPLYNICERVRNLTQYAFRSHGYKKTSLTYELLGCTKKELAKHIEEQFLPGMSWNNRGHWHIDHIIPLASAQTEQEIMRLCYYTNLRPLWAEDNFAKSDLVLLADGSITRARWVNDIEIIQKAVG